MIPNLLVNELSPNSGIADLLQYDPTLFDGLILPNGLELQIMVDTIVGLHGHTPLAHPDPNYMKYYITAWGQRNYRIWSKLQESLHYEYNPIENYDRYEDYTDSHDKDYTRKSSVTSRASGTLDSDDDTHQDSESLISADNDSDYQPERKSIDSGHNTHSQSTSSTATDEGGIKDTEQMSITHTAHVHGNIGVTTSQQMIEAERSLVRYDIYREIADSFKSEFCLLVY